MIILVRFFCFLIDITQETVLNWFGLDHPDVFPSPLSEEYYNSLDEIGLDFETFQMSPALSIDTLRLIIEGYWEKLQNGFSISEIDTVIACIIIIRFIILAIRHNFVTSFLITCIGLFAAYLWYRHFIQILFRYENLLYKIPFTFKLGVNAYQIKRLIYAKIRESDYNIRLTNPIGILFYGITNATVKDGYRIDPISMLLAWLPDNWRRPIEGQYYGLYRKIIPLIIKLLGQFYREIASFAAYTYAVRIGKQYCPYLIRWHWTMLVIVTLFEPFFMRVLYRMYYYVTQILTPQFEGFSYLTSLPKLEFEILFFSCCMTTIIITHLTCILFALFHALCGQYFYVPFITDNVELHVGPRVKTSVYSGGNTAWQEPEEKKKRFSRIIPKLWYGWFGGGTEKSWNILSIIQDFIKNLIKILIKQIRKHFLNK